MDLPMQLDKKMENLELLESSIHHRKLAAELTNELFASLPPENAFILLIKMPNGILARNVQKMINGFKEVLKNNKLNPEDCGSKLVISMEGLEVGHSGRGGEIKVVKAIIYKMEPRFNSVRASLPIPSLKLNEIKKPKLKVIKNRTIAFYYEVKILNKNCFGGIAIGFCDRKFPLEDNNALGRGNNSIGIVTKWGILIDESTWIKFENDGGWYFQKDDVIGIGIIHQPNSKLECFATFNGKLLGKTRLPPKFVKLQLFPAVSLPDNGDSIHVNFGKEKWTFKEFDRVLK